MKGKKVTNIHVERARSRMTQQQLAEKTGATRQTIHAIESGKWIPTVTTALKIANALTVTIEDLFSLKQYSENGLPKGHRD